MAAKNKKSESLDHSKISVFCNECEEICLEEDKDKLSCNLCKKIYHQKCTNVKPTEMKVLLKSQSIVFNCDYCLRKKGNEHSDLQEIKEMLKANFKSTQEEMANLKKEILSKVDEAIEEKLQKQDETQQRLEHMMNEVKDVEVNIEKKIKVEVQMYLDNQQEKEEKKCNLIIHRLEETFLDRKQQLEKDKEDVLKIFEVTNPEMKAELQELFSETRGRITRLGRKQVPTSKPRPIKVTLSDESMKFDILSGCKNLRNSAFQHISIQSDKTKEEQKQNYALRQQLKERKDKGEDVCLYNNKIILISEHPNCMNLYLNQE